MRIEIWEPRWHDKVVLIAKHVVSKDNTIVFTKCKSLAGKEYYFSGETIRRCKLGTNGKIACYEVPLKLFTGE